MFFYILLPFSYSIFKNGRLSCASFQHNSSNDHYSSGDSNSLADSQKVMRRVLPGSPGVPRKSPARYFCRFVFSVSCEVGTVQNKSKVKICWCLMINCLFFGIFHVFVYDVVELIQIYHNYALIGPNKIMTL